MGWADNYIEQLQAGETVTFRPRGHSMTPIIRDRQSVTVAPADEASAGDVVLCRVSGRQYLHRVKAVGLRGFLISRADGRENGWTKAIYGIVTKVGE